MDKETIYNQYAKEQGYESWEILCLNYIRTSNDRLICHINAVTDLIQEELKKKICDTLTLVHDMPYIEIKETINETEIL